MSKTPRSVAAVIALATALIWVPVMATAALADAPILVQDPTPNGCNGVLPTPGSENTHKRLDPDFPSDFDPGGVVGYVVDFPVDAADVNGDFEMTDCVYVDPPGAGPDAVLAKYFVHFVPNNIDFHLQFAIPIPQNVPLGSQFCNYVKTTASPSASQASNRKAGPACFTVGGGLRIEKRSGSAEGPLLGGASFTVVCTPAVTAPPTIITGLSNASQTNQNGTVSASGVAADGDIAINGPSGTPCVVTETAAPPGYVVDSTPRNLVIPVGTSQTVNVFVNQQLGSLSVSKHAVGGGGTFHFTVSCDDGETYAPFDMTVAAGDTDTHLVSDQIVVGTECTVTESANALWSTVRSPSNGTVTIDAGGETVAFTNTRLTGSIVVEKASDVDATFHFDVDCTNNAFDTTLTITTLGGSGSASISGIPTGTDCTVTEQSNPLFSSIVTPGDGTVTIAVGDNTVSFTNTRLRGALVVNKSADVDGTFHFDVDCTDNAFDTTLTITTSQGTGSASISGIPTGVECTVTEQADPHYTVQVVPANGTVTIGAENNTVAFTNTRVRGDLQINKATDADGTFVFDVDCDGEAYDAQGLEITTSGGTGSAAIPGIPTGTSCTVTEHSNPLYTTTVVPANGTVTIGSGDGVNFTNLRNRGSLIVEKHITDNSGASGPYDFTFHVACDGMDPVTFHLGTGELSLHHQIDGIPTTTVCTVTEDTDPTWITQVTPESSQVTVGAEPVTVSFTNTKLYTKMSLTKGSDPVTGTAVTDGDTITYTLSYANAGNLTADVSITDEIPAGTTYVDGSAGDGVLAGGGLTWDRSVGAEESGSVSFQVSVNADLTDPFVIDNIAFLHEGETSTPTNETHHPVAHVVITKAVDKAEAAYGDSLLYTLHVSNPSAADLTGVTASDPMPAGTTFVSASNGGTCDDPCTKVTWPGRDLGAGATFDVTFTVTINTPTPAADGAIPSSVILNTAVVDSNETPEKPSNEVKTIVTAVQGVKIVKPELPKTGSGLPIPQSVLVAIGLLLAGAGLTFGSSWRACLARAAEES